MKINRHGKWDKDINDEVVLQLNKNATTLFMCMNFPK